MSPDTAAQRPKVSAVLSALLVVLGRLAVSGLISVSSNRIYFPGYCWVLAAIAWTAAAWMGHCALNGFRAPSDTSDIKAASLLETGA